MNKKLPIILLAFLLWACSGDHDETVQQTIITGTAYDVITNQPFDSLLLEIRTEKCFFNDFGYCEEVNKTIFTDEQGKYYFTMLQNCDSELFVRFSKNDSRNYENVLFDFIEYNGKSILSSCNDNILLSPGTRQSIDIMVQPRINLVLKKQDFKSLSLSKIRIPEWDVEINGLNYTYHTVPLQLHQYKGTFEVIFEYENAGDKHVEVEYDYFHSQEIELEVQS